MRPLRRRTRVMCCSNSWRFQAFGTDLAVARCNGSERASGFELDLIQIELKEALLFTTLMILEQKSHFVRVPGVARTRIEMPSLVWRHSIHLSLHCRPDRGPTAFRRIASRSFLGEVLVA